MCLTLFIYLFILAMTGEGDGMTSIYAKMICGRRFTVSQPVFLIKKLFFLEKVQAPVPCESRLLYMMFGSLKQEVRK
jgi:hypothetical protein